MGPALAFMTRNRPLEILQRPAIKRPRIKKLIDTEAERIVEDLNVEAISEEVY
jgi:hypothetical protein